MFSFRLLFPGSAEKFRWVTIVAYSAVLCKRNIALYSSLKLVVSSSAYGRTQLCA